MSTVGICTVCDRTIRMRYAIRWKGPGYTPNDAERVIGKHKNAAGKYCLGEGARPAQGHESPA